MTTLLSASFLVLGLAVSAGTPVALTQPTPYVASREPCPPGLACESSDVEALAINLIHFRVEQAKRAQAAGNLKLCQAAAHASAFVTAGLYSNRNYEQHRQRWLRPIRTRFAGDLPEKQAIELIQRDNQVASTLYRACGGPIPVPADYNLTYGLFGGSGSDKMAKERL